MSSLAALVNYAATASVTFLMSLYLQYIKALTPREAGLILVAQPIVQTIFSPLAGRVSDRIEARYVASLGMALTVVGIVMLSVLSSDHLPALYRRPACSYSGWALRSFLRPTSPP